jgi:hypothetical protein
MTYVLKSFIKTTLYALAAVTESQLLKFSDTGGYAPADTSVGTCTPFVALETTTGAGYFTAALSCIMLMGHSAAINPGMPVRWSDTDKVRAADTNQSYVGVALDGSGDTAAVRTKAVWFGPQGGTASVV